jgi:predicted phosphate transport protein (TIGR00153 family)
MKAILELFGKSPFTPLQAHMQKVRSCVERLTPLFEATLAADGDAQRRLTDEVCRLESEADKIKNDLRSHLPQSMFLPVNRRDLLETLTLQDAIADTAQDVAITLTLRRTSLHEDLKEPCRNLLAEVTQVCFLAADITQQIDELLETSFGGKEAEKVLKMVDRMNSDETIADDLGISIARKLFALEKEISPVDVMFWFAIFRQLGELANVAERMGNQLRLLLAK